MFKLSNKRYLYHYTSLSSLASILYHKTLRLFPLSDMDDLQETKCNDLINYGRFVFVSSWTEEEEESIPMWKMYSKPTEGIRIGLEENPFKVYDFKNDGFREVSENEEITENGIKIFCNVVSPFSHCGYSIRNPLYETQLIEVEYSDDETNLYPNVVIRDNSTKLDGSKLGVVKNIYWRFQREVRYRVLTYIEGLEDSISYKTDISEIEKEIEKYVDLLPPYIDLQLSDKALERMTIRISPDFTSSNKILLQALIDRYAPLAQISNSELTALIR